MKRLGKIISVLGLLGLGIGYYGVIRPPKDLDNFRTTDQPFVRSADSLPTRKGLDTLRASGSGLLMETALNRTFGPTHAPLFVVDLRPHSLHYYRGIPLRWFGLHVDVETGAIRPRHEKAGTTFKKRLNALGQTLKWRLRQAHYGATPQTLTLSHLESEESMVRRLGFGYVNIDGDRHTVHTDAGVDRFLGFLDTLPPRVWVHFHCGAGRGRTTIFMTLYDIYRHGREAPLSDIVRRQYLLGGEDMFDTVPWPNGTWTAQSLADRKQLMIDFHRYVNDPQGLGKTPWSTWRTGLRS